MTTIPAIQNHSDRALENLMDLMQRMIVLFTKENEALEKSDTMVFMNLQPEKITVAAAYQEGMHALMQRPNEIKGSGALFKDRLERLNDDFSRLSSKNIELLSRMERTTERLANTIRKAARDAAIKQRAVNYAGSGKLTQNDRWTASTGLNETA